MIRRREWSAQDVRAFQRVLLVASGVFVLVGVLCFATRVVRSLHGQHDLITDEVLAIGCSACAIAASLMIFTTSIITLRTEKRLR